MSKKFIPSPRYEVLKFCPVSGDFWANFTLFSTTFTKSRFAAHRKVELAQICFPPTSTRVSWCLPGVGGRGLGWAISWCHLSRSIRVWILLCLILESHLNNSNTSIQFNKTVQMLTWLDRLNFLFEQLYLPRNLLLGLSLKYQDVISSSLSSWF